MPFSSYIKRNWLGLIGVIGTPIGIVGIILSFYFYKKSVAKPEPIFLVDPLRTEIIDSEHFAETPLRVVKSNGDEIVGDITSIRFYFWNNGRQPMKSENILEPLVITLDDPNSEILDYRILKCSRKVVKPKIERSSGDPKKSLSLSFAILEQEDGLTGQVIYEGNKDANFEIDGVIEGSRRILTSAIIQKHWHKEFIKGIALAILVAGFFTFYAVVKSRIPRHKPTRTKPTKISEIRLEGWIALIVVAIGLVIGMFFATKESIKKAREKTLTSAIQKVPKGIIP